MRSNGTLSGPRFYGAVYTKATVESLAVSRHEEVRAALFLPGQWSQKTNLRNLQFLGTRHHALNSKSLEGPGGQVELHEPEAAWLRGSCPLKDGKTCSTTDARPPWRLW